mmetsp:Transcript_2482/g.5195  ORF Transcript_2482/g.5195 Transcript_2482/m.5195 type:complete len:359 (+) Transcript_2482:1749-2825(+)
MVVNHLVLLGLPAPPPRRFHTLNATSSMRLSPLIANTSGPRRRPRYSVNTFTLTTAVAFRETRRPISVSASSPSAAPPLAFIVVFSFCLFSWSKEFESVTRLPWKKINPGGYLPPVSRKIFFFSIFRVTDPGRRKESSEGMSLFEEEGPGMPRLDEAKDREATLSPEATKRAFTDTRAFPDEDEDAAEADEEAEEEEEDELVRLSPFHLFMADASAKLGTRFDLFSGRPVMGDVLLPPALISNHLSIAVFSYVCPSSVTTGSCMTVRVMGQRNSGRTLSSSVGSPPVPSSSPVSPSSCKAVVSGARGASNRSSRMASFDDLTAAYRGAALGSSSLFAEMTHSSFMTFENIPGLALQIC